MNNEIKLPTKLMLYSDGSAGYYIEDNDVIQILENGWCSLHNFVKKYPYTPIYYGEHYRNQRSITKSDISFLLKCIRKEPVGWIKKEGERLEKCHGIEK